MAVQESLGRAWRQLADLTLSQKLAIGLGLALVAGSIAWMGQWAASPEMVPLLPMSMSAEDLARAKEGLDSTGERYNVRGNQIWVPASANRSQLIAQLTQADRMPSDTSMGFNLLIKESNPWLSQEENNRRWTVALRSELQRVLKQFAGVRDASVFLNISNNGPRFSRGKSENTASVTLHMSGGEAVGRPLALAAARLVSGAVQGLPLKNVEVVDAAGTAVLLWDDEAGASEGIQRRQHELEQQIARKIRDQLSFDRRIRVNVQVDLELTARENNAVTMSDPVEVQTDRRIEKSNRNRKSGGTPGVEANVGITANTGDPSGDASSVENTTTTLQPGSTTTRESTPAGGIKTVFAAVNVSRSFLEAIVKSKNPDTSAKITDKQVTDEFELQRTKITSQVAMLVKPQKAQQVNVEWYYDAQEPEPAIQASAVDSSMKAVTQYGPAAGLGALALFAIGLTLRMARRKDEGESFGLELGLPKQAIEAARKAAEDIGKYKPPTRAGGAGGSSGSGVTGATVGPDGVVTAASLPVSQADEGVLVAQEVDSSTVQVNRMIEQVGQMADQDLEGLATLVEKWIDTPK